MISFLFAGIAAAVIAATSFGSGWMVNDWREGAARAKDLAKMEQARDLAIAQREEKQHALDQQAIDTDRRLAALQTTFRNLNKDARNDRATNPIYVSCVVPDGGVGFLQRAYIEAHRAAGYGDPADVPGTVPAAAGSAKGKGNDGRPAR